MSCITVGNEKLGSVTLPSNAHLHSGSMSVKTMNQHPLRYLVYATLLAVLATHTQSGPRRQPSLRSRG
jgi:hypothetical protein